MKKYSRFLAAMLVLCMVLAMFPAGVQAETPSELVTSIGERVFVVGRPTEFTFTTVANSDAGKMVIGRSNFSDAEALDTLEYYEPTAKAWYPLTGDHFGPESGFPMSDATSTFRATFKKAGDYTFTASMIDVETNEVLCSTQVEFTVKEERIPSQLNTDIGEQLFVIGQPTEFTFSTIANDDVNVPVVGTADFNVPDAISELKYYEPQTNAWYKLDDVEFGPASGFPMGDAESRFQVTFKEAGDYTFTAAMKSAESGEILCSTEVSFTVYDRVPAQVSVNGLDGPVEAEKPVEFSVSTVKNGDADKMVWGKFTVKGDATIKSLEYLESKDGNWYTLPGDTFGPASGFPMIDGTSHFRVTFANAGTCTFTVSMVEAKENGEVLCSTGSNITVTPAMVGLTVDVEGGGKVLLGGQEITGTVQVEKGAEQSLSISEDQYWYVKQILVNGEEAEALPTSFNADTTIKVILEKRYKITTDYDATQGSVTIDSNVVVDSESTTCTVTPVEGYWISKITVVGEATNTTVDVSDPKGMTFEVSPQEDVTVIVEFVKTYTITVTWNEDGSVNVDGGADIPSEAGQIAIKEQAAGGWISFVATPNENHRVSRVVVNDVEKDITPTNDQGYKDSFEVNDACKIEITFERNQYSVTVADGVGQMTEGKVVLQENGVLSDGTLSHGDTLTIVVVPDSAYVVESVTANGATYNGIMGETGWAFEVTVTKNLVISAVEYEKIPTLADLDISITGDQPVRQVNGIYIFKDGAEATLSADNYQMFRVEMQSDDLWANIDVAGSNLEGVDWAEVNSFELDAIAAYIEEQGLSELVIDGVTYIMRVGTRLSGYPYWRYNYIGTKNAPIVISFDDDVPVFSDEWIISPAASSYGYHNSDVSISVNVTDPGAYYSGIAKVEYFISNEIADEADIPADAVWTACYENALTNGGMQDAQAGFEVNGTDWDFKNVYVYVRVTDCAGNSTVESQTLHINSAQPEITIAMEDVKQDGAMEDHYSSRTATITIIDREDTFDPSLVTVKINGEEPKLEWNGQQVEITFGADGNYPDGRYDISVSYTNKAAYEAVGKSIEKFVVDNVAPTGQLVATSSVLNKDGKLEDVQLGLWTQDMCPLKEEKLSYSYNTAYDIEVSMSREDELSGIQSVQCCVTDAKALLDPTALTDWTAWKDIVESPNRQFMVYLKIMDKAGNVTYLCTDRLTADDESPRKENVAPDITVTAPKNDIFKGNVTVDVAVVDPKINQVASGLNKVTYQIVNEDTGYAQNGDLASYDDSSKAEYAFTGKISVDSSDFNSNNVTVYVYATDRAGNPASYALPLKIDITAPTIDIDYDNDVADSESYYDADRVATIVVTERNFRAEDVKIQITNSDGVIPKVSGWTERKAGGNGDATTYTATIRYSADGDYTFSIDYTDLAGNNCPGVVYATDTTNPEAFTIDQTAPVVSVAYDNNAAANGKYFNAVRTATITVVEHNFELDRVEFTRTTDRGGKLPEIVWVHSGDTHQATIYYGTDGDYTFGMTMKDLAGNENEAVNYGDSVAAKDFVIDTTCEDMITYEGVEKGEAYGDGETVIPSISISDINLLSYDVKLVGVQKDQTIDLTEEVNALLQTGTETVTGVFDLFAAERELDGIYTLTLSSSDKAGNEDSETVVFTVNRFGSVYVYDDYLLELIANGGAYKQQVEKDLVLTEFNADKLLAGSLNIQITCDGRPLENVIFTTTPSEINDSVETGESGWYQYKYTISKDNFKTDGVYKISVSSEDATGNTPENSNYEDMGIAFQVDSTKAEITSIIGLEESIINADSVTVKYTVFDTIGLKGIKVYVNDELVDEITDFSADMNNYDGSFVIGAQSYKQSVRIVVEDMAGNVTDTDAAEFASAYAFNDEVTISTNFFVRWYANTWLFWGSIIGTVALIGIVIFFIVAKGKKKEEDAGKDNK